MLYPQQLTNQTFFRFQSIAFCDNLVIAMPRRCTICLRSDVKAINKAICNSQSYRKIAIELNLSESALNRHIDTCLNTDVNEIKNNHRVSQIIDVHAEFAEQLAFAKDLREAAKKWLVVADEIDLDPRSTEVQVVYLDLLDKDDKDKPKQKKESLSALLDHVDGDKVRPTYSIIKTVDLRKFALDAINTADLCIDKFAKLFGLYQKDAFNERDIDTAIEAFCRLSASHPGFDREGALDMLAGVPGMDVKRLRAGIAAREVQELEAVQ